MKRRSFLKIAGGVGAGIVAPKAVLYAAGSTANEAATSGTLPKRTLGRTGRKISIVGFPGLALIHHEQEECNKGLRKAFDQGVNYYDVAPAYGNGDAEIKMGIGLEAARIPRDKIFLACKTKMRDAKGAREELERSLKRLKTDHFDLFQLHHLRKPEEVSKALGPDGAMETILKAQKEGKIKHIGFSAHTTKGALEAMKGFSFDTVMFPVNYVEYYNIDFGREVIETAKKKGAAVLAIKPLSLGAWPEGVPRTRRWWYRTMEDVKEIELGLRFALSQPGVISGIPPSFLDLLDRSVQAMQHDRPIKDEELKQVKKAAGDYKSIFIREEQMVARNAKYAEQLFEDCPFYGCPGEMA